jgi:NAD(P)-dependent dehydrogenase (short-subunit alcohol dehydrogenase family)
VDAPLALVTGAGRGIGRQVAIRLSAAGYRLVLTARTTSDLASTAAACAGPAACRPGDITDAGFVESLFETPVSVLVANAGGGTSARIERTTDADWQRMLDLNLTAPFRCIRAAVPGMRDAGAGRIVVIASTAAKIGEPYISAYTASKHGVLGLVRSVASELAGTGITVNAVCPGYVDTPMTDSTIDSIARTTGRSAADARAALARKQPIGRLVDADEVADAVLFCVRNAALTGQGINVDGGAVQS